MLNQEAKSENKIMVTMTFEPQHILIDRAVYYYRECDRIAGMAQGDRVIGDYTDSCTMLAHCLRGLTDNSVKNMRN